MAERRLAPRPVGEVFPDPARWVLPVARRAASGRACESELLEARAAARRRAEDRLGREDPWSAVAAQLVLAAVAEDPAPG